MVLPNILESINGDNESGHTRKLEFSEGSIPTLSFEFFPPKTDQGMANLMKRMDSMSDMKPEWIDVTFGAGGSTKNRTLEICEMAVKDFGMNVMMHLTCTNMSRNDIDSVLGKMKSIGIRNVLALRGDPPTGTTEWITSDSGFSHAVDLVRYIRSKFDDYFCIAVAGYPEGHADSDSFESDLHFLKEKVDAGADVVVTQLFYDTEAYFEFVQRLRHLGVRVPVIPGVMPISSLPSLKRMSSMCRVHVPDAILNDLEAIKEDEEAVREYGVNLAAQMCKDLLKHQVAGVHIYTMNNEDNIREIVKQIAPLLPSRYSEWLT